MKKDMIKRGNEQGTSNKSKINKSGVKLTEQSGNGIKVAPTIGHKMKKDKDVSCC